ncbi:hypothetical protein [Nitrososphaeria virus YSH_1032793]|uniref:Uncharacterized protein n=1 Tax=Nitrososphaeria virus YSH_1032793 TaxID=3071320 RepID=A0A976YEY2_9CAUD|nr:hypothetical protein QKV91_gp12 [Yangshan Harbor Nitrososphaeria virus]UVF62216.1 hypothetical protein [Nitrososphaeria virus YSH_1032793]
MRGKHFCKHSDCQTQLMTRNEIHVGFCSEHELN